MKNKNLDIIKEYRITKLIQVMGCFDKHPFDRDAQRECVLKLYDSEDEKSIFRGMVIPSLRHLGLILGYEEDLRLSANGNLIVIGQKKSEEEGLRIFRTILAEMDNQNLKIIKLINLKKVDFDVLKQHLIAKIEAPSEEQAKERINHWVSMLLNTGLLMEDNGKIDIVQDKILQVEQDLDISAKLGKFKDIFFEAYLSISKKQENVPIVDIPDVRTGVATVFYLEHNLVVTESEFDEMLRAVPLATEEYVISLGRAMGAEEKLFKHEDNYYRTISIRFLNKEERT